MSRFDNILRLCSGQPTIICAYCLADLSHETIILIDREFNFIYCMPDRKNKTSCISKKALETGEVILVQTIKMDDFLRK